MKVTKVHCFFEQSGVFKNEFRKLGISAYDYDIQNNFSQTDYIIDLFVEIEKGYNDEESIFDFIDSNDLIIAFFPCIYFCENNQLYFSGKHYNLSKLQIKEKIDIILFRSRQREFFYAILLKLFAICDIRGLRLILENPATEPHYLSGNFPYKAAVIDNDRTRRGDYYKKPTQYWFVNCVPTFGSSFQPPMVRKKISSSKGGNGGICSAERSLISSEYAKNFINDFIFGSTLFQTELF